MSGRKKSRAVVLSTILVLSVVATGVAFTGTAAAEEINQCKTITESGTHTLGTNLENKQSTCIRIEASDVIFDGNGKTVDGTGTGNGILVEDAGTLTNVTVRDVTVTDWRNGIIYRGVENGNLTSSKASSNEGYGLLLRNVSNSQIMADSIERNDGPAVRLIDSTANELVDNTVTGNDGGVYLRQSSSGNTLTDNNVSSNAFSGINIVSEGSDGNVLTNNTANSNADEGIVFAGSNNNLTDNTANSNADEGIAFEGPNNNLTDNNATGNGGGIVFEGSNNNLMDNTANSNADEGIAFEGPNNNLTDNNATGNGGGIVFEGSNNNLTGNDANNNGVGILLRGSNNNLTGNNASANEDSGIALQDSNKNTLTGNTAKRNDEGIAVYNSKNVEITGNTLESNAVDGGSGGAGITIFGTINSTVSNNEVNDNNLGIYVSGDGLDSSINNNITGNDINGTTGSDGIGVYYGSDNTIENNTVTNSADNGIILSSEFGVDEGPLPGSLVSGNDVIDNNASNNADDGLNINNATDNLVRGNEFRNNGQDGNRNGITLDGTAQNNTLTENVITGNNGFGIRVSDSAASGNLIYDNYLEQTNDDTGSDTIGFQQGGNEADNDYNVTPRDEENIIGGDTTAGNYYAQPGDAQGYSEQCVDEEERFGICDNPNDLDDDPSTTNNADEYPLTMEMGEISAPANTQFGDVTVGDSETRTITVENEGNGPVTVTETSISGADAGEFSVESGGADFTLESGKSKDITVEFTPDSTGDKTADLTIDTENDGTETVDLSGTGQEDEPEEPPEPPEQGNLDVPANTAFGNVTVDETKTRTVTLSNEGNAMVEVIQTSISGADGDDFTVVGSPNAGDPRDGSTFTIAPGESRDLTVRFAPDSTDDSTATLVSNTANDGREETTLTGTGIETGPDKNVITIRGTGPAAQYALSVTGDLEKSTANGANTNTNDEVYREYAAQGEVGTLADSYTFNGTLETLKIDGDAEIFLNGERLSDEEVESKPDNVIEVAGTGPAAQYVLSVTDALQKSTANFANHNDNDEVLRGYVGDGEVGTVADSYTFDGSVETIGVNGDAEVYLNGERMDASKMPDNGIEVEGTGPAAQYAFTATADSDLLQKITANDANRNDNDETFRTTANGEVGTVRDAYGFNGIIDSLNVKGDANVYVNGRPKGIDSSGQAHVITIMGTGPAANYEFTVGNSLDKSIANFANLNQNDEIAGTTATGEVGTASDSFVYNGDISAFSVGGDVQVYIDGEQIDQGSVADEA